MNILGVGPTELILVLLIMLIVAGPKRMARWAFVAGQYTAKLRAMWQETSKVLKEELANAGIEPDIVDSLGQVANPRTRNQAITKQIDNLVGDLKAPLEEAVAPVNETVKEINSFSVDLSQNGGDQLSAAGGSAEETAAAETSGDSEQDATGQYKAWTSN